MRTQVTIDGTTSLLAQGQDLTDLRRRIEEAVDTDGRFVDFVVVGNRTTSVLVTPRSRVVFSVETVHAASRDTGDLDSPFGGYYDL